MCVKSKVDSGLKFDGQELILETQELEPDQIIWDNLKHSRGDQNGRKVIVFLISILVALISIVSTLYFEG